MNFSDKLQRLLASGLVDDVWYRQQYPDVEGSGLSAVEHYARYGASLGRDPSPYFSTHGYLERFPELSRSGCNPLWHYIENGQQQLPFAEFSARNVLANLSASSLEAKLWAGFSEDALPALLAKSVSPAQRRTERSYAAWALARWYAFRKNYTLALKYLLQRRELDRKAGRLKAHLLLEADCLNRLGQPDQAQALILTRGGNLPEGPDGLMVRANCCASAGDDIDGAEQLALISLLFTRSGYSPIKKLVASQPLSIFNLENTQTEAAPDSARAKVSIVMPAFNAADQITMAIRSLQEQTWGNFEILVADDCSTDSTRDVVRALAADDPRIILVCQDVNGGAYAARNAALQQVSGDFVTVHDSDDWSHAQKLETQVRHLLANSGCIANLTDWTRALENLYFTGTFRAHGSLVSENTSSLMFRREVVETLGGWDLARTSADTEFVLRLQAYYGQGAVERLYRGQPLSIALDQETSLTRTPATHAKTLFYGARREYREAAQAWHRGAEPTELRLSLSTQESEGASRRFPIPLVMRVKRPSKPVHYDVVVIADFDLNGGAFVSTMNYVNAALSLGKRVALFHWRRCDLEVGVPLKEEVRARAQAGEFDMLTAGDVVSADLILVGYPVVLNYKLDEVPEIDAKRFLILVNQMASRLITGEDRQYEPGRIQANVQELFGIEPLWVPISGYVKELMWEDTRYPVPHDDVWSPLLDVDNWCQFRVQWRGEERAKPVIGRHSRDHYTKWPITPEALAEAYCVGRPCEVMFLGGAAHAISVLGEQPENWEVLEYAETTHEFLQELDFFVHFPHEQYIEEFGRAVLEAMGLGIPVVLPPVFRKTFGVYANYAEPHEVWDVIETLWADEERYRAASDLGLRFVRDNAHYRVLAQRLERLG